MLSIRRAFALSLLLAGGCLVDVDYGGGEFLCADNICNEGFECVMGRCVRSGQDAGPGDAGPDAAVAPVVPGFSTPVPNLELSALMATDDDASFTEDRFYVVFNSDRGGAGDLWSSTRASLSAAWRTPEREAISSMANDSTIAISSDGLSLLFGSDRPGGVGGLDLWLSTRLSRSAPWGAPVNMTALNSTETDAASWISDGATQIIFHSDRDGDQDLYLTELDTQSGDYSTPRQIPGLATPDAENSGRFAAGGLVITFHSNRTTGLGRADLYSATRASIDDPFGPSTLIEGVNSAEIDEDAWLSDDLCYLAFAATDANGDRQIFESTCISD